MSYEKILLKIQKYGGYWFGHLPIIRKILVFLEDWFNNKGLPCSDFRRFFARTIHFATGNSIFYLDYVNGSDANDGSTWALAWKTITSGATAARIAPGDTIRIAKSEAPTSLGINATWTNLSKTVTLASALNANIELCETAWTASTNVTCTADTTYFKQGTYSAKMAIAAGFTTGKAAYKTISSTDFSAYQKISFWIFNSAAISTAGYLQVKLCSDTAGVTAVDTFDIPAIPSTNRWIPLTIARTGGGNLGSAIQSVALYVVTDFGAVNIYLDNIIACTTSGLNLQSLISKNSSEQGGTEAWYGIQSINGTTVLLDNETNTNASAGKGYYGTTETVTTYKRETIKTALAASSSTNVQAIQDSGTLASYIRFEGGYDTSTSNQTGETFFDGLNGQGYGISFNAKSYCSVNYIDFTRYYYGLDVDSYNEIINLNNANNNYIGVVFSSAYTGKVTTLYHINNNGNDGVYLTSTYKWVIATIKNANNNLRFGIEVTSSNANEFRLISCASNNTYSGLQIGSNAHNNIFYEITLLDRAGSYSLSLYTSTNNIIHKLHTSNGASGAIDNSAGFGGSGINFLRNALLDEATELASGRMGDILFSHDHDQTTDNHWIFFSAGATNTINAQTATRHTASGVAWRFTCGNNGYDSPTPLRLVIARVACSANNQVTVKVWMKKDHATNVAGRLMCRGGQIAGVTSDVSTTKADDTNWEELTINFTPTEAGVVEIEAQAWYVAASSYVYVDDMTISQA